MASAKSFSRSPTDWDCPNPACRNVNFARRDTCNRCQTPRPEARPVLFQRNPYPVAAPAASGGRFEPQPGDWQCASCQNVNWARRDSCNRCGNPKDAGICMVVPAPALATGPSMPTTVSPDDWACGGCGNVNWARRTSCNWCQSPKPVVATMPAYGALPAAPATQFAGDWACPACANINFARRDACNRCQTPKPSFTLQAPAAPDALRKPFKMMKDDWCCPNAACGNVNFARRTHCNRCGTPKV